MCTMKMLIDVDGGTDDAVAILMALSAPDVDVVAITVTHGNTNVHQATTNILRVLKLAGRLDVSIRKLNSSELRILGIVIQNGF